MYNDEEWLKEEQAKLKKAIEELEKEGYSTKKRKLVDEKQYDSDAGMRLQLKKEEEFIPMSLEEIRNSKINWEIELYALKRELEYVTEKLLIIEFNKSENGLKNDKKEIIMTQEQIERLAKYATDKYFDCKSTQTKEFLTSDERAFMDDYIRVYDIALGQIKNNQNSKLQEVKKTR